MKQPHNRTKRFAQQFNREVAGLILTYSVVIVFPLKYAKYHDISMGNPPKHIDNAYLDSCFIAIVAPFRVRIEIDASISVITNIAHYILSI